MKKSVSDYIYDDVFKKINKLSTKTALGVCVALTIASYFVPLVFWLQFSFVIFTLPVALFGEREVRVIPELVLFYHVALFLVWFCVRGTGWI